MKKSLMILGIATICLGCVMLTSCNGTGNDNNKDGSQTITGGNEGNMSDKQDNNQNNNNTETAAFSGRIIFADKSANSENIVNVTVIVNAGEDMAKNCSDIVTFSVDSEKQDFIVPGNEVKVNYDGMVEEIYPANIPNVESVEFVSTGEGYFETISQSMAYTLMAHFPGKVTIVDVRQQDEYAQGHIVNAILIPDNEIADRAEKELPDKQALLLIYCRSGRRSKNASQILADLGYTNVKDFGGIIDWEYETEK